MSKRFFLFLTVWIGLQCSLHAQDVVSQLHRADELYDQKNYTEAYEIYHSIFHNYQLSSPEMLVKMAYINEGLEDYSMALYYLNLYYRQTSERAALKKMESLAKEHQLVGYEFNDLELLGNIYYNYYQEIVYLFLALSLLWFALIYRNVRKSANKPVGLTIGYVIILSILFVLINFGDKSYRGIITNEAFLMEEPSAAARMIDLVDKGHKVRIAGEDGIWMKIKWDDQTAYIRKNNIITLN